MIRVLHIVDTLQRGGAESMIMNLYRRIDRNRIQFDFVMHTDIFEGYYDEIIELGGCVYSAPRFKGTNIFTYLKWWTDFYEEHNEYRIAHCHMRSCAAFYIHCAKKRGLKIIAHSHSTSNGSGISAMIKGIMQYPIRYQADYFFACSQESANWLFGKRADRHGKSFILKNAIDLNQYAFSMKNRATYRELFSVGEGQLLISHVGNYTDAKNHAFIIELFANILKKTDAKLILVGNGTEEQVDRIKSLVSRKQLENCVIIAGSRSDVNRLLSAADVFVFPSLWEGFGMAALEAQANGLHTFLSDTIPEEVAITELAHILPINQGGKLWSEAILKSDLQRKDVAKKLRDAGYDIEDNVRWLSRFYLKVAGKMSK